MDSYAEVLRIDLGAVHSEDELLSCLGEVFEFGGPNGNVRADSRVTGKGWGMNWNAVFDSLSYLDTGGIYGTSRIPKFPLCVKFIGGKKYKASHPASYVILADILAQQQGAYALRDLRFVCEFL